MANPGGDVMRRITALLDAVDAANHTFYASIVATQAFGFGWVKQRWQVAVTLVTIGGSIFGAGAGTVLWVKDWREVPDRLTVVEARLDTLTDAQAMQNRQWERLRCELIEALRDDVPPDCDRRLLR